MTAFDAFLSGESPDHVAAYFSAEVLSDAEALSREPYATPTDRGVRIVVPAGAGRAAFESATGIDPMDFASGAMGTEGTIEQELTDGECPASDEETEHELQITFAFAEEQNEDVGGLYADGDVIHAYAHCSCGERYSDKWVVDDR